MNLIAAGLFTLADSIERAGFHVRILNTVAEEIVDKQFRLSDFISEHNYGIVCFSLHWHYQAFGVVEHIEHIKTRRPEVRTIVGGYTASVFSNQIMHSFPAVDYLIRGEAEKPIVQLLRYIRDGHGNLETIANLEWREKGGRIRRNQGSWVADSRLLNSMDYAPFHLLRHADVNLRLPEVGFDPSSRPGLRERLRFFVATGRGCSVQCYHCGGGAAAQRRFVKRNTVVFRSPRSVLKQIRALVAREVRDIVFDFDPKPVSSYYVGLFRRIAAENWRLNCVFASWALPTLLLVDTFYAAFEDTELVLSPDFGNEHVRKCNKGFFFSNVGLLNLLQHIDDLNRQKRSQVGVVVYFFVGGPNETEATIRDTTTLAKELRKFQCVRSVIGQVPQVEPGSPLSEMNFVRPSSLLRIRFSHYVDLSRLLSVNRENPDMEMLMGRTYPLLSKRTLVSALRGLNAPVLRESAMRPAPQLRSLDDILVRSSEFHLDAWVEYLQASEVVHHWSLRKNGSQDEQLLSHVDALVYQYVDGHRNIAEILRIVQQHLLPVNSRASMKAFFDSVGLFLSNGGVVVQGKEP